MLEILRNLSQEKCVSWGMMSEGLDVYMSPRSPAGSDYVLSVWNLSVNLLFQIPVILSYLSTCAHLMSWLVWFTCEWYKPGRVRRGMIRKTADSVSGWWKMSGVSCDANHHYNQMLNHNPTPSSNVILHLFLDAFMSVAPATCLTKLVISFWFKHFSWTLLMRYFDENQPHTLFQMFCE